MSLTVHHLRYSQSERVVWLCEELTALVPGFHYELVLHDRDATTALAPSSLKDLSLAQTAPVMVDSTVRPSVLLAESQAIVEYIIQVHGQGNLSLGPTSQDYAHYLLWYNFANGSLQPGLTRLGTVDLVLKALARHENQKSDRSSQPSEMIEAAKEEKANATDPLTAMIRVRLYRHLNMLNKRLGETQFLAGKNLTAADIMIVFSLTTMRGFYPYSLKEYSDILRYLKDIAQRPAYQQTLMKAERGMRPMVEADVEPFDYAAFK